MKALRATITMAGVTALSAGLAAPAAAQVPDEVVLNIMRECAKIDDPTSRLACYDNNIRTGGFDGRRPVVPGAGGRVEGSGAPAGGGSGAEGFGAESIKSPDRFESYEDRGRGPDEIRARVTSAREREPGIYLVTLDSGAQWIFTDAVSRAFRPPVRGSTIEIQRASLGSFLMVVDDQAAVRVRRVK